MKSIGQDIFRRLQRGHFSKLTFIAHLSTQKPSWAHLSLEWTQEHSGAIMSTHDYSVIAPWVLMSGHRVMLMRALECSWRHGSWQLTASYGCSWVLISSYNCSWVLISSYNCSWVLISSYNCSWVLISSYNSSWVLMTRQHSWFFYTLFSYSRSNPPRKYRWSIGLVNICIHPVNTVYSCHPGNIWIWMPEASSLGGFWPKLW